MWKASGVVLLCDLFCGPDLWPPPLRKFREEKKYAPGVVYKNQIKQPDFCTTPHIPSGYCPGTCPRGGAQYYSPQKNTLLIPKQACAGNGNIN